MKESRRRLRFAVFIAAFLYSAAAGAEVVKTMVSGAVNWSDPTTWMQMRSGTLSVTNGSNIVTGTGTAFLTELSVGDILVNDASPSQFASITAIYSNTSLAMSYYSNFTASGIAYGRQAVPGSTSDVQIGHVNISGAVNLTLDVASATVHSITLLAANPGHTLTHTLTNSLTVTGDVTINQPAIAAYTNAWYINGGTATVNGNLNITGTTATATCIGKAVVTTGTLTIGGNLVYNSFAGASAAQSVVDISGGAATLRVGGSIQLNGAGTGTLTPGANSTVIFNGTGSQNIATGSAIDYYNLTVSKTGGSATLAGNETITGSVSITQGTFSCGSYTLTVPGNWTNNGTFSGGTGTVVFSGTGAQTISGTGTHSFYNIQLSKTAGTTLSASGVSSITAQSLTQTTGNFTAPTTLFLAGTLTLSAGTFTAGTTLNVAGDFTNNATFSSGTGTVVMNGTAAQTISGSATTAFRNLTVTNSSAAVAVSTNINISGTLSMSGASTVLTPAAGVIINNSAAAGTLSGTGKVQVTRILATADFSSQYKFTTNTLTNLTVDYAGAGAQTVNALSYGGLSISGSGTKTAAGAFSVSGGLNVSSGATLNMSTFAMSGSPTGVTGSGTLQTANVSTTPLPSGLTWPLTVAYTVATGGQSIVAGTYSTALSNANSSGTNTATGILTINGTLTLPSAGGYMSMSTYAMGGNPTSISGAGTLQTYSTSATPLPASEIWPGTVEYKAATGGQTVVGGTYGALSIFNTSGSNASGAAITVSGALTLNTSSTLSLGAGTHTVSNVALQTGSVLTLNNSTMQMSGSFTATTGDIAGSNGTLVMNGSSAQSIPAGIFVSNTLKNLTTGNAAGVTLGGTLSITGILKATTGAFASGGFLTLISNASGTALIDGSGAGSVTGSVTVQRYLPSGYGYRYISSPVQSATVASLSTEVDLSASFPALYRYDESSTYAGWVSYTTSTGALNVAQGYAANFGSLTAAKTVDISGTVNNGSITTGTIYNRNRTYTLGYNLVGNPYPSPIDWTAAAGWTKTNIDNAIYYFNPGAANQYIGTYSSYVNGVSSDGVANNIIPSMQGFFIHVSNGSYPVSGSLTMTNSVRTTGLTPTFHRIAAGNAERSLVRLRAAFADDTARADFAAAYFEERADAGFNADEDALKMDNTDERVPNLYFRSPESARLSVSGLPALGDDERHIPLGITAARAGHLLLQPVAVEDLPQGIHAYLTDAAEQTATELTPGSVYRALIEKGTSDGRFYLVFSRTMPAGIPGAAPALHAFSAEGGLSVYLPEDSGHLHMLNTLGQTVLSTQMGGKGWHKMPLNVGSGIYVLSLSTDTGCVTGKVFVGN